MLPPRPLLSACLLLLGGLAWAAHGQASPAVPLADAARWEGQSVTLEGWARGVRAAPDGTVRLTLADSGSAVSVRLPPGTQAGDGDRLAVAGRLGRLAGALTLFAEDPGAAARVQAPAPASPSWDDVAADPAAWDGRLLRLAGEVEDGALASGRHALALGAGPWPAAGAAEATGLLRYDPSCLCHRLDAREVRAWTP